MDDSTKPRPFSLFTHLDLIGLEILDLTHDCLLLVDLKTRTVAYANKACEKFYGYSQEELTGLAFSVLSQASEPVAAEEVRRIIRKYPQVCRFETAHRRKNGRKVPVEVLAKLVIIAGRRYCLSHVTNIGKQNRMKSTIKTLIKRLSEQATRDYLTGAYSRAFLYEGYVQRVLGKAVGLALLDIKSFSQINHHYGHQAGDFVLAEVAKIVADAGSAKVFRYGGDELLIIAPGLSLEQTAEYRAELSRRIEAAAFIYDNRRISCSVHIGIAQGLLSQKEDLDQLIRAADIDLYRYKNRSPHR